ncbi:MAG: Trk system potassium transporter TrkA [Planctomycetes bacterium]|nr:Trk system potassium transporter TrkA [Planctomycetota bacterium]MCB9909474.1 Trk system potassium transporter TrkA [Planctomycetota bacterium]
MNIVIVGSGEVGYHLASILSRDGHGVTVVDPDPLKAQRMQESLDVQVIVGDGTRASVLADAGTSKADLMVAVTDNDHVNMLACALSKKMGAKRRIVRLRDTTQLEGYLYFYKHTLGFDVVLSTQDLAAEEIISTVRDRHALGVDSFAGGRVQLRRLRLEKEGLLTGGPLANCKLPGGVLVVAVQRKERFFVPGGGDHLEMGDQVWVIGASPDLDSFELLAAKTTSWKRNVVIMGGGGIASVVLQRLKGAPGVSIKVIEKDRGRARSVAASASSNVMVLEGDATDLTLLREERIGESNVFIATTADDEDNMVACQLARSLGVERTVALVSKASYRDIYDLLGIDQAISPRILCANSILRFVRSGSPAAIAVVGEGMAEVLELTVRRMEPTKVRDLSLPRGTVIGARVREDVVLVPSGSSTIQTGDSVIVFTLPENLASVQKLFGA